MFTGKGKLSFGDFVYEGEFKDDKLLGPGTYTFNDGSKQIGEYVLRKVASQKDGKATKPTSTKAKSQNGSKPSSAKSQSKNGSKPSSAKSHSQNGSKPSSAMSRSQSRSKPSSAMSRSQNGSKPSSAKSIDSSYSRGSATKARHRKESRSSSVREQARPNDEHSAAKGQAADESSSFGDDFWEERKIRKGSRGSNGGDRAIAATAKGKEEENYDGDEDDDGENHNDYDDGHQVKGDQSREDNADYEGDSTNDEKRVNRAKIDSISNDEEGDVAIDTEEDEIKKALKNQDGNEIVWVRYKKIKPSV